MQPTGKERLSEAICPWPEVPPRSTQPERTGRNPGWTGGTFLTCLSLCYCCPASPVPTIPNPESKWVVSRGVRVLSLKTQWNLGHRKGCFKPPHTTYNTAFFPITRSHSTAGHFRDSEYPGHHQMERAWNLERSGAEIMVNSYAISPGLEQALGAEGGDVFSTWRTEPANLSRYVITTHAYPRVGKLEKNQFTMVDIL